MEFGVVWEMLKVRRLILDVTSKALQRWSGDDLSILSNLTLVWLRPEKLGSMERPNLLAPSVESRTLSCQFASVATVMALTGWWRYRW